MVLGDPMRWFVDQCWFWYYPALVVVVVVVAVVVVVVVVVVEGLLLRSNAVREFSVPPLINPDGRITSSSFKLVSNENFSTPPTCDDC